MKRSDALAPLSRDHHQALAVALRLRRAADPAADRAAFLAFFEHEGAVHFAIEEDVVLPTVAEALPVSDPDVRRVLDEHAELRRRAAALAAAPEPDPGELRGIGELLAGHVRHEERVLFGRVEEALDADGLRELGRRIAAAEQAGGSSSV